MSLSISDLTVLLIEPSSTQAKILQQVLEEEGIDKLDIKSDGASASEYLNRYQPDLVISAMYYPDMTAIELLSHIRQQNNTADVNFMLVSTETNFEMLDSIKQAGVLAILPKPFDRRDFRTALTAARDTLEMDSLQLEHMDLDGLSGLIVDDSSTARRHISKLVNAIGVSTLFEAENGREAIELLNQQAVDFIISDYNMPEMNGKELAQYLRNSEFAYLPILMVTSEADSSRLNAVKQAGVCALFDKTIDPQSLKTTLAQALNQ